MATYVPVKTSESNSEYSTPSTLEARLDDPMEKPSVRFVTWDPEQPEKNQTPFSRLCEPLRVTLDPGDILYLPALWYHRIGQSCGEEGFCCALNYW